MTRAHMEARDGRVIEHLRPGLSHREESHIPGERTKDLIWYLKYRFMCDLGQVEGRRALSDLPQTDMLVDR